jgi:chloride channel protein, CIC family
VLASPPPWGARSVSPQNQRRLLPVGAAAGVAAAFNAPIAAVTFTVEEIVGNLDQTVLSGVIVAAAVAAVVERSVLGTHPVFAFRETPELGGASSLIFYALLGLLAALVAVAFTDSLLRARAAFRAQKRIPAWAHPGIGGLITGALALLALFFVQTSGITGGGYATLGQALNGGLAVKVLVVLCVLKLLATVSSYSSGGAGGIFAPSLFIGAMLGGAVGALDMLVLHHGPSAMGAFALVGMGAVFAAVVRAPITSVLIIIEMTSGYSLALPLMIANMSAYALARSFRPLGIYEALLEQDGIRLDHRVEGSPEVFLESILGERRTFVSLSAAMSARELIAAATNSSRQQVFPVLNGEDRLVGLITLDHVAELASEPELDMLTIASDVMQAPVFLRPSDDLRSAFESMVSNDTRELPVVDEVGRVIAMVEESAIARAYLGARHRASTVPASP